MELYESFNEFVNEGIKFGKKGIEQRIKDSIEYCEHQLEAGDKRMKDLILKHIQDYILQKEETLKYLTLTAQNYWLEK